MKIWEGLIKSAPNIGKTSFACKFFEGENKMNKEYLGDAVYAEISKFGELILTTEDGIRATNVIVLDGSTLLALEDYIKRMRKQ